MRKGLYSPYLQRGAPTGGGRHGRTFRRSALGFACRGTGRGDGKCCQGEGKSLAAIRVRDDDCITQGIGIGRVGGPELDAISTVLVQPAHLLIVGGVLRVARRPVMGVSRWGTERPGIRSEQYGRVHRLSAEHEYSYR